MEDIWIEEPIGEEFPYVEEENDSEEDKELLCKLKPFAKQISRRLSMALIVRWLYLHNKEPHRQMEIAECLRLNQGTVSFNLNRLAAVGVVKIIRLKGIDSHPLYQLHSNAVGKIITERFLWLVSFKLLKTLPRKDIETVEELKRNMDFMKIMNHFRLSFDEAIESLRLNHHVELQFDRERKPYSIKLKDLPLGYYKKEKQTIEEKPVAEEIC